MREPCLDGDDEEEQHVGQHVREGLVQEPGGEPAVGLRAHQRAPARAPHDQEVAVQQPGRPAIAPGHALRRVCGTAMSPSRLIHGESFTPLKYV